MRKKIVLLALVCFACSDDSALERRLEEHEKRIAALEKKIQEHPARAPRKSAAQSSSSALPSPTGGAQQLPGASIPIGGSPTSSGYSYADPRLAIRAFCAKKWGSNWQMVEQCEKQETEAMEKVYAGNALGVPPDVYRAIRANCEEQWGAQFTMQLQCQQEEAGAYAGR